MLISLLILKKSKMSITKIYGKFLAAFSRFPLYLRSNRNRSEGCRFNRGQGDLLVLEPPTYSSHYFNPFNNLNKWKFSRPIELTFLHF